MAWLSWLVGWFIRLKSVFGVYVDLLQDLLWGVDEANRAEVGTKYVSA